MFLAEAVWAESDDNAALHRATAELFALAAQIGSDTFAAFLITQVMKHLAETPSPQKCALASYFHYRHSSCCRNTRGLSGGCKALLRQTL